MDFIRGHIEPHAPLMDIPPGDHLLLKIMSLDNFERSLQDGYLHFNRVDCYDVDPHDGEIAPEDRKLAKQVAFEKAAKQTLADYYDQCRSRSYACCFTMENSPEMWSAYGGPGGQDTKVGIEVRFSVLRRLVNEAVQAILETETGPTPHWLQLFSVNYGRVQYGDWRDMKLASDIFPNPVVPVLWKDGQRYGSEKELRIALSAIGIGQPLMGAARTFEFPKGLSYPFDLRAALMGGSMALRLDQPTALDRLRRITEKAGFSLGMRQDSGAQGKP